VLLLLLLIFSMQITEAVMKIREDDNNFIKMVRPQGRIAISSRMPPSHYVLL
jgi:hypothetical protein